MKTIASTLLIVAITADQIVVGDKTSCATDISLATASLGAAGLHIKAAVADCQIDAIKCTSDISSTISNLGNASAHIS